MTRRALFLDRDGTAIEDTGYPRDPALVRLLPGAAATLRALKESGWLLAVISNQSGIGRGIIAPEQAAAVHERFTELLAVEGVVLDAVRYCPHAPEEACSCRKPSPEMILRVAEEWRIDLAWSVMIGDKDSDVEAGRRAGCRAMLFGSDCLADFCVRNWHEVLRLLLGASGE